MNSPSKLRPRAGAQGSPGHLRLNEDKANHPGALLVFSASPEATLARSKLLARALPHVYSLPESALPFYLEAAERARFVWSGRDGRPSHGRKRTHIRSDSGLRLEFNHQPAYRAHWQLEDGGLGRIVRQAV